MTLTRRMQADHAERQDAQSGRLTFKQGAGAAKANAEGKARSGTAKHASSDRNTKLLAGMSERSGAQQSLAKAPVRTAAASAQAKPKLSFADDDEDC